MFKYPKIRQYKDALFELRKAGVEKGTIRYVGRPKIHGTNASIVYDIDGGILTCQSRNRVITPDDDNLGFASWLSQLPSDAIAALTDLAATAPVDTQAEVYGKIAIYGEWCGKSIQDGVGVNHMEKTFVIFGIRVLEEKLVNRDDFAEWKPEYGYESHWVSWVPKYFDRSSRALLEANRIFFIDKFPSYSVTVDIERPYLAQNFIAQATKMVEDCCPVASIIARVPEGVKNVGEGLVWMPQTPSYAGEPDFWFKTKGEEHSASKVKTIAPVNLELAASLEEFVDKTVTTVRLRQAMDYLREMSLPVTQASTGQFIRWVFNDIVAEEADVMEASGLSEKDVGRVINNKAKAWFFEIINDLNYEEPDDGRYASENEDQADRQAA